MASYIEVGAEPANVVWNVVRGDTATLLVQFFESDEVTPINTDEWTYSASAFNQRTNTRYTLGTQNTSHSATIIATPDLTEEWGTGVASTVAELTYDLQVNMPDGVIWTPVIGTIRVAGDVTGATL